MKNTILYGTLLSFFMLFAGCASDYGPDNSSPSTRGNNSSLGWKGWDSVLDILERRMVDGNGSPLAAREDFQTKLIGLPGSASTKTQTVDTATTSSTTDNTLEEKLQNIENEVSDTVENAQNQNSTNTATSTVASPVIMPSSATLQINLFAKNQVFTTQVSNVPIDSNGIPTAASARLIEKAAQQFKADIFDANVPVAPTLPESAEIDALLEQ